MESPRVASQMKVEIWKTIPSFPLYRINNFGAVELKATGFRPKIGQTYDGYDRVSLRKGNGHVSTTVHILVCEAFHGRKPTPHHEVAHADGSKTNNQPSNLRWVTKEDNYADSVKHGTYSHGSRHGLAKLTEEIVRQARKEYATGVSGRVLAKKYGVSGTVMYFALNKTTWKHV